MREESISLAIGIGIITIIVSMYIFDYSIWDAICGIITSGAQGLLIIFLLVGWIISKFIK